MEQLIAAASAFRAFVENHEITALSDYTDDVTRVRYVREAGGGVEVGVEAAAHRGTTRDLVPGPRA